MATFEWTEKEKDAIKKAISHWLKDIVKPLRKGETVKTIKQDLCWEKSCDPVPCHADSCALCNEFFLDTRRFDCPRCPYTMFYGVFCASHDSGHWYQWISKPSLITATAMLNSLRKLLK